MYKRQDIDNSKLNLTDLAKALNELGEKLEVEIRIQHEDIFNSCLLYTSELTSDKIKWLCKDLKRLQKKLK